MKKVCFVPVDDKHYYLTGTPVMINSFKRFHPDIDLVVIRQNTVDKLFQEKKIDWYNATPYFAQLLFNNYDLVAKMDADHVVTGRMTEIFDNVDYYISTPSNFFAISEAFMDAAMALRFSSQYFAGWAS